MQLIVFLAAVTNVLGVPWGGGPSIRGEETGAYVHEVITAEPYVHMEPIETHHIDEDITAEPYVHIEPIETEHFGELVPKIVNHSNVKLSTKLYDLLRRKYQNLVFSPFSISTVMAMLSAGARGETLHQINKGVCDQPAGVGGPCYAYMPRWTFNRATRTCEQFVYGGCQGNKNSFGSKAECEKKCGVTFGKGIVFARDHTGPNGIKWDQMGPYWTIRDHAEPNQTIQDHTSLNVSE